MEWEHIGSPLSLSIIDTDGGGDRYITIGEYVTYVELERIKRDRNILLNELIND